MSCAPKNKGKRSYTCLPRESLLKIVADYNKTHNDKIKMSKSNKVLWKRIKKKLNKKCNTEWCWIDQDFISYNTKKDVYKYFKQAKYGDNNSKQPSMFSFKDTAKWR